MCLNPARPLDSFTAKPDHNDMKTISVSVTDGFYRELQDYARQKGQSAEDLVREVVETLNFTSSQQPGTRTSALALKPLDLGKILRPLNGNDDLLGEMLDGNGH
jgi:hypothetical protein